MKDYDAVKDVINNMPTVYDLDKVVEQLEYVCRFQKKKRTLTALILILSLSKFGGGRWLKQYW